VSVYYVVLVGVDLSRWLVGRNIGPGALRLPAGSRGRALVGVPEAEASLSTLK